MKAPLRYGLPFPGRFSMRFLDACGLFSQVITPRPYMTPLRVRRWTVFAFIIGIGIVGEMDRQSAIAGLL